MRARLVNESLGAPVREANPCHDPKNGRFAPKGQGQCTGGAATLVGITSSRPGRANRQVFQDMAAFHAQLSSTPGVSDAKVSPGLGAWEGGSEPTWVVSYRGNGEALKLIARTAKAYNQDGVLLMKPCRGRGCDPAAEIAFEGGVSGRNRPLVHDVLTRHGLGGWTWYKSRGKTVLRMVSVPVWGGERAAHLAAVRDISATLKAAGLRHTLAVKGVKTETLTRETYDRVIGERR